MAAFLATFTTSEIAVTAATAKTVLQILAATNHRIKILGWGIYFDGVSPSSEPAEVQLLRQTTAIGGSPTAITGRKVDPGYAETIQTTAAASAGGAEPTSGDLLKAVEVHPQAGYEEHCPFGQEYIVAGAGRVGIVVTLPTGATTVNCRAWVRLEE